MADARSIVDAHLKSVMSVNIAYLGIIHRLFNLIRESACDVTSQSLAAEAKLNQGYVEKWLDAAVAFGFANVSQTGAISLAELGEIYVDNGCNPNIAITLQSVYTTLITEKSVELFTTGVQPGYSIVNGFNHLVPWYGYIFESLYAPVLRNEVIAIEKIASSIREAEGAIVDFGCGSGWLLRELAAHNPSKEYLGIDGSEKAIQQARSLTPSGNIRYELRDFAEPFACEEPVGGIVINRSLHHFGAERSRILEEMAASLSSHGFLLIWDFNWLDDMTSLRSQSNEDISFLHIIDHIQGNAFLKVEQVVAELSELGLKTAVFFVNHHRDYVILASK